MMIVLGVVLIVAAALLFWVVWASMEPSEIDLIDLRFEAAGRVDKMPLPQQVPSKVGAPFVSVADAVRKIDETSEYQRLVQAWLDKGAVYYAPMLALAQGRQKEAATKAMLVPAAAGVLCFILGFVSFRARLIAAGIVLLGLTAVYATFLIAKKDVGESEAALYILVIAVAGLSGLVCTTLGMARFLATSKGA